MTKTFKSIFLLVAALLMAGVPAMAQQSDVVTDDVDSADEIGYSSKVYLSINPYGNIGGAIRGGGSSLLNASNVEPGVNFDIHIPVSKKCDIDLGVGYIFSIMQYQYPLVLDAQSRPVFGMPESFYSMDYSMMYRHIIQVPLSVSVVTPEREVRWSFGVAPGYVLGSRLDYSAYNPVTDVTTKERAYDLDFINRFRCEFFFGMQGRASKLIYPGCQLYINLAPTYIYGLEDRGRIHEFGIRIIL